MFGYVGMLHGVYVCHIENCMCHCLLCVCIISSPSDVPGNEFGWNIHGEKITSPNPHLLLLNCRLHTQTIWCAKICLVLSLSLGLSLPKIFPECHTQNRAPHVLFVPTVAIVAVVPTENQRKIDVPTWQNVPSAEFYSIFSFCLYFRFQLLEYMTFFRRCRSQHDIFHTVNVNLYSTSRHYMILHVLVLISL